jgi:ATP-dependent Clp protease ATP-binding subunit ClpB
MASSTINTGVAGAGRQPIETTPDLDTGVPMPDLAGGAATGFPAQDVVAPRVRAKAISADDRQSAFQWLLGGNPEDLINLIVNEAAPMAGNNKVEPEHLALALMRRHKINDADAKAELKQSAKERATAAQPGENLSDLTMDLIVDLRQHVEDKKPTVSDLFAVMLTAEEPALAPFQRVAANGVGETAGALAQSQVGDGKMRQLNLGVLNKVGVDWTVQAADKKYPGTLIGRRVELDQIWAALDRDVQGNAVLVGPPGVGKTQILRGLVQDIVDGNAPARFQNARAFAVDIARIAEEATRCPQQCSPSKTMDEIVEAITKARAMNPPVEIILVMDEIEELRESRAAQANLLRELRKRIDDPTLQLHVVGAANPDNYELITGGKAAQQARFEPVMIGAPPDDELSATILHRLEEIARMRNIQFDPSAASMVHRLGRIYSGDDSPVKSIAGQSAPRAQVKLLDGAAAMVSRELANREGPLALRQANQQLQMVRMALQSLDREEIEGNVEEMRRKLSAQFQSLQKKVTELKNKGEKEKDAIERLQRAAQKIENPSEGDDPAKLKKALETVRRELDDIVTDMPPKGQRLYNLKLDGAAIVSYLIQSSGRDETGKFRLTAEAIIKELHGDDANRALNMRQELDFVIGQDHAKDAIANAHLRRLSGVGATDRLLDIQFLAGPSGAGKTVLVKKAAEVAGDKLERFDGGDYMQFHELSKLIGAPDGYVGYDERGGLFFQLCKKYARPVEVDGEIKMVSKFTALFDEAEKYHPALFLWLMNIIDEGCIRWKDEVIYLYDTKMYFTSNLGNKEVFAPHTVRGEGRYDSVDAVRQDFNGIYEKSFPPEIRGRLPEPIIFNPHGRKEMRSILDQLLKPLFGRMDKMEVPFSLGDAARDRLIDLVLDKADEFGGRLLDKHTIPNVIETPVGNAVMQAGEAKKQGKLGVVFDVDPDNVLGFVVRQMNAEELAAHKKPEAKE